MKHLVSSTDKDIQAKISELHNLSMYNLATGKLKKKYVKKQKELTTLEKISRDFNLINK